MSVVRMREQVGGGAKSRLARRYYCHHRHRRRFARVAHVCHRSARAENDEALPIDLQPTVRDLVAELVRRNLRVVFAESCTAGLVSASLAAVPGVSEWLCGSAVTYQVATKTEWLGVPPEMIRAETAVSALVAEWMARAVLEKTPHADLAASITGHLGPGAPEGFDGLVFIGIARRVDRQIETQTHRFQLSESSRLPRQSEAAKLVLQQTLAAVERG